MQISNSTAKAQKFRLAEASGVPKTLQSMEQMVGDNGNGCEALPTPPINSVGGVGSLINLDAISGRRRIVCSRFAGKIVL